MFKFGRAAAQLLFQAFCHHRQWPGPDHGAVIRAVAEVLCVLWVSAVGWVGDEHACSSQETSWEGASDVVGGLVDKRGQLVLTSSGVEQEMAKAVVRVHDGNLALVVGAIQRQGMKVNVTIDGVGLIGAGEIDRRGIR